MAKKHTVKQGESLTSIAERYGFLSSVTIYDDPDNQELWKMRHDPNLLYPGDEVSIPDLPEGEWHTVKLPAGSSKELVIEREPVMLRLKVLDHLEGPAGEAMYELQIEGLSDPLTDDVGANGEMKANVPAWARKGRLTLKSKTDGAVIKIVDLEIGHLDPVATPSGLRERLRRIGFDPGPDPEYRIEQEDDELGLQVELALRDFQVHYDLEETGTPTDETQKKLAELTGV